MKIARGPYHRRSDQAIEFDYIMLMNATFVRDPAVAASDGVVAGRRTRAIEPAGVAGEFQWGGIAGTHWWISPRQNLAGLLMTQRHMAFWHPFSFEFKREVYRAVGR